MEKTVEKRVIGIILGASDFSRAALPGGTSFANSASDFRKYLLSPAGLKLAEGDVLYLFDDSGEASVQLDQIAQFLLRNQERTDTLLTFYVGHGGFTPNGDEYFLVVRSTRKEVPWASGIRMRDLAHVIREYGRFQRRYLILDCCFSAQAYKVLQSAPLEVAAVKVLESMPTRGTSLLSSSGSKDPSLAPADLQHTMFSEAFLQVLKTGEPHMGPTLTLRDVRDMVVRELRRRWDSDLVRPEVHSPDQSSGDISDLPLFPNPGYRPGAELKELTVMFSDIRNSTSWLEKLSTDELAEVLNEYLTVMTDVLFDNLGTLDKYIGDAIMAFWGSPNPLRDHAYRACCCALGMINREQQLNRKWAAQGRYEVLTNVGLNSGLVMVGNFGSEKRLALTVMGDNVNLASRLEGLNKEYGTRILAGETTYNAVRNSDLVFCERDFVRVKGKLKPMVLYELVCRVSDLTPDIQTRLNRFAEGRRLYQHRDWTEAQRVFQSVIDQWPDDGPSRLHWRRCQEYLSEEPPSDWDGVYITRYR